MLFVRKPAYLLTSCISDIHRQNLSFRNEPNKNGGGKKVFHFSTLALDNRLWNFRKTFQLDTSYPHRDFFPNIFPHILNRWEVVLIGQNSVFHISTGPTTATKNIYKLLINYS